eukprot:Ihof_evm1s471 gene=Ihof_evmTU1s471
MTKGLSHIPVPTDTRVVWAYRFFDSHSVKMGTDSRSFDDVSLPSFTHFEQLVDEAVHRETAEDKKADERIFSPAECLERALRQSLDYPWTINDIFSPSPVKRGGPKRQCTPSSGDSSLIPTPESRTKLSRRLSGGHSATTHVFQEKQHYIFLFTPFPRTEAAFRALAQGNVILDSPHLANTADRLMLNLLSANGGVLGAMNKKKIKLCWVDTALAVPSSELHNTGQCSGSRTLREALTRVYGGCILPMEKLIGCNQSLPLSVGLGSALSSNGLARNGAGGQEDMKGTGGGGNGYMTLLINGEREREGPSNAHTLRCQIHLSPLHTNAGSTDIFKCTNSNSGSLSPCMAIVGTRPAHSLLSSSTINFTNTALCTPALPRFPPSDHTHTHHDNHKTKRVKLHTKSLATPRKEPIHFQHEEGGASLSLVVLSHVLAQTDQALVVQVLKENGQGQGEEYICGALVSHTSNSLLFVEVQDKVPQGEDDQKGNELEPIISDMFKMNSQWEANRSVLPCGCDGTLPTSLTNLPSHYAQNHPQLCLKRPVPAIATPVEISSSQSFPLTSELRQSGLSPPYASFRDRPIAYRPSRNFHPNMVELWYRSHYINKAESLDKLDGPRKGLLQLFKLSRASDNRCVSDARSKVWENYRRSCQQGAFSLPKQTIHHTTTLSIGGKEESQPPATLTANPQVEVSGSSTKAANQKAKKHNEPPPGDGKEGIQSFLEWHCAQYLNTTE